jgi:hypothetical protein
MKKILPILLILVNFSCSNIEKLDTGAVKKKMNNYKIKKILEVDIIKQTETLGDNLVAKINNAAPQENCIPEIGADSLSKIYFLSLENIEELKTKSTGKLAELLDAYQYALNNQQDISNNIQKINDTSFLFTFKLKKEHWLNLNCGKKIVLADFKKSEIIKSMQ